MERGEDPHQIEAEMGIFKSRGPFCAGCKKSEVFPDPCASRIDETFMNCDFDQKSEISLTRR